MIFAFDASSVTVPANTPDGSPSLDTGFTPPREYVENAMEYLAALVETIDDLVAVIAADGTIYFLNASGRRLLNVSLTENKSANLFSAAYYPVWVLDLLRNHALPNAQKYGMWQGEVVLFVGGRELPMTQTILSHQNAEGQLSHFSTVARDNSKNAQRLQLALESANATVWEMDIRSGYIVFEREWLERYGYRPTNHPTQCEEYLHFIHPDDREEWQTRWQAYLKALHRQHFEIEHRVLGADGRSYWMLTRGKVIKTLQTPDSIRIIGTQIDISSRKQAEQRLNYLAYHDVLTGLPNRVLLTELFNNALTLARRNGKSLAIYCLDIDYFKKINEMLGHYAGDRLLQVFAARVQSSLDLPDHHHTLLSEQTGLHQAIIGRFSSNGFVIVRLIEDKLQDTIHFAQLLLQQVRGLSEMIGHDIITTASIGISLFPENGYHADELIKHAESAMHYAKNSGGNGFKFFNEEMNTLAMRALKLESGLLRALEHNRLSLQYQPQIDALSGKLVGLEALVRWRDPDVGIIPPNQFIPFAEERGLISEIGDWVLREACRQNKTWQDTELPIVPVAVNVSVLQFQQPGFFQHVQKILQETGLSPEFLELEPTETALAEDVDGIIQTLHSFKKIGVGLAIDDFGTGYSSLNYLRRFPVDKLKIDRSFVKDACHDQETAALVRMIIQIGNTLNKKVIAEGVETLEQLQFLQAAGCHLIQGYYFSQPCYPEEIVERWLTRPLFPPQET